MTKIALSRASGASPSYARYIHWLQSAASEVKCVDLWAFQDTSAALQELQTCSGLLLTGGPDVHPERYNKSHELSRCEIDTERDTLEFALFDAALERKMPVLGICRGAQVINVALGGTLVVDIPTDLKSACEHRRKSIEDSIHGIQNEQGSLLIKITGQVDGVVNSAHHQAVDALGRGLRIAARSEDAVNEAIEWLDASHQSFLLGVQWHPERMDYQNPFSLRLAQHFIFESESYSLLFRL